MQALTRLSKQYENKEVIKAVRFAEFDRNRFWRLLQKCRKNVGYKSLAVKREDGIVVHEIKDVLEAWRKHFSVLWESKDSPAFDSDHFRDVTNFVQNYNRDTANDDTFLDNEFSRDKIRQAIKTLNVGRSPGYDCITAEHLVYACDDILDLLYFIFNAIRDLKYVPECFRVGVQVPLFKGKDLCNLDPNNYRGITLLSTFNKVFEILVWNRMKRWWMDERVISKLQGACKTGLSCIHTAFSLQEAIATSLEEGDKCVVAFYDVSKAFDAVWIDGLFRQVFDRGITGKTWRLLYRSYVDFRCCAKVQGHFSNWYTLYRGIHQGGYMSLLRYTVFINSLLIELRNSGNCCRIY